jgi:hypothetical protein
MGSLSCSGSKRLCGQSKGSDQSYCWQPRPHPASPTAGSPCLPATNGDPKLTCTLQLAGLTATISSMLWRGTTPKAEEEPVATMIVGSCGAGGGRWCTCVSRRQRREVASQVGRRRYRWRPRGSQRAREGGRHDSGSYANNPK